ncbi:hypothetical protein SteCoe_21037 [Stentor coeruleus]|uniref:Uncharacterized protein n=1 Tax=Stentor coeruleus TaxID=5963 RepID=A0A1R2BQF4_9CILI|nr:hypothetical protein SteCoe_21037 [Stentor coeruleus]
MEIELDKLLDQASAFHNQIDPKNYSKIVNQSYSRPSLMHISSQSWKSIAHRLGSFGPYPTFIADAGSSEEGSDDEICFPSIRQVTESILDSQYTNITDASTHTRYHSSALIIFNLDKRLSIYQAKSILMKMGSGVIKVVPVDFASESGFIHCGIVYFSSLEEASSMYNKLSKYERRGRLGSKLQRIPGAQIPMSVRWFTYQVLDSGLEWTSVILRGLRQNTTKREIEEKFSGLCIRAEQPRKLNGEMCTLVIVKSIYEADKIIKNYKTSGLLGKADLHPYSSIFKNPELSLDIVFHEYRKRRKMLLQPGCLKILRLTDPHDESEDARSLISSVSGTVEDGEITDTDAPSSDTIQNCYLIYEFPGSYINKDEEVSCHSGVHVKTILSLPNNMNNLN